MKLTIDENESNKQNISIMETNTGIKDSLEKLELEIPTDIKNSKYGPPTDGGYGWLVVVASFSVNFVVSGPFFIFALFLQHYSNVWFKESSSLTTLAFIGTLAVCIVNLGALITGILADRFGYRICILLGGWLYTLGFLLASFSSEIWHLFITQGVMVGVGTSICYIPAMSAPSQWFNKMRGLTTGIAVAGGGIGGFVLSPIVQLIIDKYGVRWALRFISILSFVVLNLAALIIRERTEPKRKNRKFLDFKWFKNQKFNFFFLSGVIYSLGYSVPLYLIVNYSVSVGLTVKEGSIIVSLLNASSAIGRILFGILADKIGRTNVLIVCIFITMTSVLVIWPLAINFGVIVLFVLLYGSSSGGYVALTPVIISNLFGLEGLATVIGMVSFGNSIPALVGTPIASAILTATKNSDGSLYYLPVILYTGACIVATALCLIRLRFLSSNKIFINI